MIIVTAYTPDYKDYAMKLVASANKFNVPIEAVPFESRGSWQKNEIYKPVAIRQVMNAYSMTVMWLDADMWLTKEPDDFYVTGDVAWAREWRGKRIEPEPTVYDFKKRKIVPNTKKEITVWGGWMLFRHNPRVLNMLNVWNEIASEYAGLTSDEQTMMEALRRCPDVITGELFNDFAEHRPVGRQHGKPKDDWL